MSKKRSPSSQPSTQGQSQNSKVTVRSRRAQTDADTGQLTDVEQHEAAIWSGVLPSPEDMERFNAVIPNGAERIMRLAEREQEHRISVEQVLLPQNISAHARGQWLGAAISMLAIVSAALTGYLGVDRLIPIALVGVPVLAVARALVDSFKSN